MLVDDPAWAEVRRLYVETNVPVREIARRFELSESAIFARRAFENWPARSARRRAVRTADENADAGGKIRASRGEHRHQALVRRLYTAIDLRLQLMEKRMRDGETLPATEEEREARGLGSLVRSLEKVLQIDPTPEKSGAGGTSEKSGTGTDIERRRHAIAERLEKLEALRNAPAGSG